jgi:hypothetical protein
MYQLFYDGGKPQLGFKSSAKKEDLWGTVGRDARFLRKLALALGRMQLTDRNLPVCYTENGAKEKDR